MASHSLFEITIRPMRLHAKPGKKCDFNVTPAPPHANKGQ
jgi:hypothetical protein